MRKLIVLLLTATLVVATPAPAHPAPPAAVQVTTATDPVVYVAGDSIVASAYLMWPDSDGFRPRLANRLCGVHCGTAGYASVYSVACPGQRLTLGPVATGAACGAPGSGVQPSLASEWPYILAATPKPTTIVVGIGINEMGDVTDGQYQAAYQKLMDQAAAAGVRVIPCTMSAINPHMADYAKRYNQRYWLNRWLVSAFGGADGRSVARFDWATKIPSSEDLDPWYEWNSNSAMGVPGDGLHPNRLGVVSIADAVPVDRVV